MKTKMVIFDFDGVIVQTETIKLRSLEEKLHRYGVDVKGLDMSRFLGMSRVQLQSDFDRLFHDHIEFQQYKDEILRGNMGFDSYRDIMSEGVAQAMKALISRNIICSIGSNSSHHRLEAALEECNLREYITHIGAADVVGAYKPKPDIYLWLLKQTGFDANECVVVEDSTLGIAAAKAANIYTVALHNPFYQTDQSMSDRIIHHLHELPDLIAAIL